MGQFSVKTYIPSGSLLNATQQPFRMVQEFLPELEVAGKPGDPSRVINIGSVAAPR